MKKKIDDNIAYLDPENPEGIKQGISFFYKFFSENEKMRHEQYQQVVEGLTNCAEKQTDIGIQKQLLDVLNIAINKYKGTDTDIYTIGQAVTYIVETNNLLFKDIVVQKQNIEVLNFLIEDYLEEAELK
jgi:hypothetical protein